MNCSIQTGFSAAMLVAVVVVWISIRYYYRKNQKVLQEIKFLRDLGIGEASQVSDRVEAVLTDLQRKHAKGHYVTDTGRVISEIRNALQPPPGTRMSSMDERK